MTAQLNLFKEYKKKNKNIPFELEEGVYRVRFKVPQEHLGTDTSFIINKAVRLFIIYFLPEYYIHLKDPSQVTQFQNVYDDIRTFFADNLVIENPGYNTAPPSNKKYVVTRIEFKEDRSFFTGGKCIRFRTPTDLRDSLEEKGLLPDFLEALYFFNEENEIHGRPGGPEGNLTAISEFQLSEIQATNETFGAFMEDLAKQKLEYSGPANLAGIDFSFANRAIQNIINIVLKQIVTQIPELSQGNFAPGDSVSFLFSQKGEADPLRIFVKNGVAGLLLSTSESGTDYVKIGYFSNIKYRRIFDDPVILASIKNYQEIFTSMQEYQSSGRPFPISDFLSKTLPEDTLERLARDNAFVFRTDNPNAENLLLQEAQRLGLIDLGNNDDLKRGIAALTEREQQRLKQEIENNPELAEKMYQQQRRHKLETGVNIAETVSQIAETGLPFAQGSAMDTLMEKLGIKALAREALICLTFGLNVSIARIADAVADVMEEELNERPAFDLEQFEIFKIKGDFAKVILDAILNSIQQALFALLSGLAELLAQLCDINNPGRDDYGANDFGDLINNNLNIDPGLLSDPLMDALSDLVGGCGEEEIMDYLTDLSDILSSIDICNLMLSQGNISDELLDRILDFNETYPNPCFSENLNSPNALMAFFELLGQIADITDFCNDVANQIIILNPDICECLDPDTLAALSADEQETLDDLLDIIEDGLSDPPPQFSFDCPDAENYLEDPVMTKLIPETFNTLLELVQMQFIYSADSVKQALLDKVLRPASGNPTFQSATATDGDGNPSPYSNAAQSPQNDPGAYPELPQPNQGAINALKQMIEDIQPLFEQFLDSPGGQTYEAFQSCVVDQPNLLRPEIRDFYTVIEILLNLMADAGFADAMGGLADNLDDIATAAESGGALAPTYQFKKEFYNKFVDYVKVSDGSMNYINEAFNKEFSIANRFEGSTLYLGLPGETSRTVISFGFQNSRTGNPDSIKLTYRYPPPSAPLENQITLDLNALYDDGSDASVSPELLLQTEFMDTANVALDIGRFVESVQTLTLPNSDREENSYNNIPELYITSMLFPYSYGILVDQVFDYYRDNGIFDAAALLSLNFFHDNENCPPADVADFLDVDGIFRQMQQEYLEAACADEGAPRDRMMSTLQYGLFLLLVQVHIAELIIKNIFVFGAVRLDDLFDTEFVRSYVRNQIDFYVNRFFDSVGVFLDDPVKVKDPAAEVEKIKLTLVDLFNRKIKRELVIATGGIKDEEGVVVFEPGTEFVLEKGDNAPDNIKDFNDIIIFLTTVRIQYSTGVVAGEERTPGPVVNAVKKSLPDVKNPESMEEIFLRSMPCYYAKGTTNTLGNLIDQGSTGPLSFQFDPGDGVDLAADVGKPKFIILKHRVAMGSTFDDPRYYKMRYRFFVLMPDFYGLDTGSLASAFGQPTNQAIFELFMIETPPDIPETELFLWQTQRLGSLPTGFTAMPLTPREREFLLNNETFNSYFTDVFNKDIIGILPILQNFYLGKRYLSGIEEAMLTTKAQVVTTLQSVVSSGEPYDSTPNLSRPAARTTGMSLNGPNPDTLARDFILKMLI